MAMENNEIVEAPKKEKVNQLTNLVKGFIKENPVFVMLLGMCPSLATTTSIEKAFGMGILFFLVLICTNTIISLLRKVIPNEVRIPCYIVIIAGFVTMASMLCHAYLPDLYTSLGTFLSLIVVNCIVLGRAEAFASKNGPLSSFIDAVGMGIGFTGALILIAFFREFFGTGGISIGNVLPLDSVHGFNLFGPDTVSIDYETWAVTTKSSLFGSDFSISILQESIGGFIVMGLLLAFLPKLGYQINKIKNRKKENTPKEGDQ